MNALSAWITANQAAVWSEIQTDPTWAFLKATTQNIFELTRIVDARGWTSAEQAAADIAPLNAWAQYIDKPIVPTTISFTRADLPTVPWTEVYGAFTQAVAGTNVDARFASVSHADVTYGLLTLSQIQELAAKTPSTAFHFQAETMDCDDFSNIMKGWIAANGLGNASVGIATYNAYNAAGYIDAHAALVAVDTDHHAWWLEPQTGEVHPITELYAFPSADRAFVTDMFY